MSSNKFDLIAHYEDIDGLLCHVLAERAHPNSINHYDIAYGKEYAPFEEAVSKEILFCDLGYSNSPSFRKTIETIQAIRSEGRKVNFFDHHDWSKSPIPIEELFDHVSHDRTLSSTPILQRYLGLNDTVSTALSTFAYADDHNYSSKETTDLTDCLKSRYDVEKLISHLAICTSIEKIIPSDSKDYISEYRKEISQAIISLQSTYQTQGQAITGLSPKLLYMKKGFRQMKEDNPSRPILCFYENTNQALFRVNTQEEFDNLTSRLPAGGRDLEGGITLDSVVTKNNYEDIKLRIIGELS